MRRFRRLIRVSFGLRDDRFSRVWTPARRPLVAVAQHEAGLGEAALSVSKGFVAKPFFPRPTFPGGSRRMGPPCVARIGLARYALRRHFNPRLINLC